MARRKEFDPEQALDKAMRLFWRSGYDNTSLEELIREMGIARQSLYDTFGDKRTLYMKALDYYRKKTNSGLRELLDSSESVTRGFTKVLLGIVAETPQQQQRGCLLLNANLERNTTDTQIRKLLRDNQTEVEAIFVRALRRAQKQGELTRGQDPAALALFFIVTIQGMRSMARLKSDRHTLRQVARVALKVFAAT